MSVRYCWMRASEVLGKQEGGQLLTAQRRGISRQDLREHCAKVSKWEETGSSSGLSNMENEKPSIWCSGG